MGTASTKVIARSVSHLNRLQTCFSSQPEMTGFGGPAATTGQLIAKPTTQSTAHTTAQPTVTNRDRLANTQPTAQPNSLNRKPVSWSSAQKRNQPTIHPTNDYAYHSTYQLTTYLANRPTNKPLNQRNTQPTAADHQS